MKLIFDPSSLSIEIRDGASQEERDYLNSQEFKDKVISQINEGIADAQRRLDENLAKDLLERYSVVLKRLADGDKDAG